MSQHRSKNPDLLFPDVVYERTPRVMRYFMGYRDGELPRKMDRVTAFVTHRCNYLCVYCNGPHTGFNKTKWKTKKEMIERDMTLAEFKKMVSRWAKFNLSQIHFTGGEPTLNKDLISMVSLAKSNGILSGITTNGSADFEIYKKLIDNGMTEIRISIEADNEEDYFKITGRKDYFKKVINNIEGIVKLRDIHGKDIFLVLNTCVGEMNIEKIERLLKFFISLNPDDIKFLVVAMEKESLSKRENQAFLERLNAILDKYPQERFVLLRDKINKLFDVNSMGLRDNETQKVMKHCYVPLTERTITPTHYYPCSIYIRGYGRPLGKLSDSFEEQQKKILKFVKNHNCREDKICSQICTNCCKLYNLHVNREVDGLKKIRINKTFSEEEVRSQMKIVKRSHSIGDKKWFLIIKPLGQPVKKGIKDFLKKNGIRIIQEIETDKWREMAIPLYRKKIDFEKIEFALYREEAFRKVEGDNATILFLDGIKNENQIKELKKILRTVFPTPTYLLVTKKHREILEPHTFHIPNEDDLEIENGVLKYFLDF